MAAMLRSPVAGLALRRSSASLRLSLARIHSTPASSFSAADRTERRRLDEKDEEETEKVRRRRAQERFTSSQKQRHGVSHGDSSDGFFDTTMLLDIDMKPRHSATHSTRASSSAESSMDDSSRSPGGFWNKGSSWSWGSGDSGGGGGDSCSGGGDCGGGD